MEIFKKFAANALSLATTKQRQRAQKIANNLSQPRTSRVYLQRLQHRSKTILGLMLLTRKMAYFLTFKSEGSKTQSKTQPCPGGQKNYKATLR